MEQVNGRDFKITVYILDQAEPLPCLHHIREMRQHFADLGWNGGATEQQRLANNRACADLLKRSLCGAALEAWIEAIDHVTRVTQTEALRVARLADPNAVMPNNVPIAPNDVLDEFKRRCSIDQRSAYRQLNYIRETKKPQWLSWSDYYKFFRFQERYRNEMLGSDKEQEPLLDSATVELLRRNVPLSWHL